MNTVVAWPLVDKRSAFTGKRGWQILSLVAMGLVVLAIEARWLTACGAPQAEQRLAIVIGAGEYTKGIPTLSFIRNDVEELARVLVDVGYAVVKLVDQRTPGCLGASRSEIEKAIKGYFSRAEDNSVILVYLSGHGVKDPSGEYYFLPVDADPGRLRETAISVQWLRQQLEQAQGKLKLLILDTCHAAELGKGDRLSAQVCPIQGGFKDARGVYVLASCQSEEKSLVWSDKGLSLFTYWLVRGLKGQADGVGEGSRWDGLITADELFYYTRQFVPVVAKKILGRDQHPDRLQGPGVAVDCPVIRVTPQPFEDSLEETAELISVILSMESFRSVAVPDFHIPSDIRQHERPLGDETARWCADRLIESLTRKKPAECAVLVRETLQEELRRQGLTTAKLLMERQIDFSLPTGFEPCVFVAGLIERWEPREAYIRVRLRHKEFAALTADFRMRAILGDEHIDTSSEVPPIPEAPHLQRWSGKESPFRVYIYVREQPRPMKLVQGRLYVPLDPGDVYQIRLVVDGQEIAKRWGAGFLCHKEIDPKTHKERWIILARVLVDGKSTLPEVPRIRKEGPELKAVAPEAKEEPAQSVPIAEARPWFIRVPDSGVAEGCVPGFVTRLGPEPAGNTSSGAGAGSTSMDYREFLVVQAKDAAFPREEDFSEQLGVITVAYYTSRPTSGQTRGPVSTELGEARETDTEMLTNVIPDRLLAMIKIHYVTRSEWERLEGEEIRSR